MAIFKFRNLKSGQATPVPPGEFTVGRAEDSHVQVDDPSVSRHHARLINDDKGFFLEDLGSANGVALHGAYVTGRSEVKLGDLIHIGKVPFRLDPEVGGETATPPPSAEKPVPMETLPPIETPPTEKPPSVEKSPSAELKPVDRDFARKETERISTAEEARPAIVFVPPLVEPGTKKERKKEASGPLIRKSVPLPTLVRLLESPNKGEPPAVAHAADAAAPTGAVVVDPDGPVRSPSLGEPETMPWWWWGVVFLAGLGSGLLLGLFFARLFLQMGGKPSSLP